MALLKLSRIRKALIAAVPPLLPLLAFACSVPPASKAPIGFLVYTAIIGELGAVGVYAVTNAPETEPELDPAPEAPVPFTFASVHGGDNVVQSVPGAVNTKFVGAADQVVPPSI